MTPLHPEDLPLLTDIVVEDGKSAGIPTLTEVVARQAASATHSVVTPPTETETHSIAHMAAELIWNVPAEPVVEQAVEPVIDFLIEPAEPAISEAKMQELVSHFEVRLETIFTEKLNRHFEHLHHQAVKLAISELKEELPELLRNVLKK